MCYFSLGWKFLLPLPVLQFYTDIYIYFHFCNFVIHLINIYLIYLYWCLYFAYLFSIFYFSMIVFVVTPSFVNLTSLFVPPKIYVLLRIQIAGRWHDNNLINTRHWDESLLPLYYSRINSVINYQTWND